MEDVMKSVLLTYTAAVVLSLHNLMLVATSAHSAETRAVRLYNQADEYFCEISIEPTGEYWAEKCTAPGSSRLIYISLPDGSCLVDISVSLDDIGKSTYEDFDLCQGANLSVDSIHETYE